MNEPYVSTFVVTSKKNNYKGFIEAGYLDVRDWSIDKLQNKINQLAKRANQIYETDDSVVGFVKCELENKEYDGNE